MTSLEVETAPQSAVEEVDHIICCFDPSRALCGADVTGQVVTVRLPTDNVCVVCDDIELNSPGYCPRGFVCPIDEDPGEAPDG